MIFVVIFLAFDQNVCLDTVTIVHLLYSSTPLGDNVIHQRLKQVISNGLHVDTLCYNAL